MPRAAKSASRSACALALEPRSATREATGESKNFKEKQARLPQLEKPMQSDEAPHSQE